MNPELIILPKNFIGTMLPFRLKGEPTMFEVDDYIYVPDIRTALRENKSGKTAQTDLYIKDMTENECQIVEAGCLINFNRNR